MLYPFDNTITFKKLLNNALEEYCELDFPDMFPMSSRYFTAQEATSLLEKIKEAHNTKKIYELNYYHIVLIWELMKIYYSTDKIERYFDDTDFLWEPDLILNLTAEQKKALGLRETLFGVILGLKPHKEELLIKEIKC